MRLLSTSTSHRAWWRALRARGVDAFRVTDFLDPRASDEEILAEAARQSAVVVSRDQDLTAILATTSAARPSLVNLRVSEVEPEAVAALIQAAITMAADELTHGAVVTVDDGGTRVHSLPIR